MKKFYRYAALMLITALFSGLFSYRQVAFAADSGDVHIRANQVGYKTNWAKEAFVLSQIDLTGQAFTLKDSGGAAVFTGTVGEDRGSWGNLGDKFPHVYTLDFSSFQTSGDGYTITAGGETSFPFSIGDDPYSELAPLSLEFFKTQRCGDTDPSGHDPCHLTDGVAADGPMAGTILDATGGWHDAADYINFMVPASYCTYVMLASYLYHPGKFPDPETGLLAEAKIGLDFMEKMWDNEHQVLYMSVADADEHGRWDTWPEDDNFYEGPRPVYSCPEGTGANIAGKAAAAFALASEIWSGDEELASRYRETAIQLYDFGKENEAVAADRDGGYEESEWKDDMALGAAELYRATGTPSYLDDAKAYAGTLGLRADGEWPGENLSWSREYHWANYAIAKLDPTYAATAAGRMGRHLNAAWWYADENPWYMAMDDMRWSSNAMLSQLAVEACMYKELSGLGTYMPLAQREFNYLLGSNPWGVSFLNSAGTNWFVNPRHRVDYLHKQTESGWNLVGAWSEGATSKTVYDTYQNDHLDETQPDAYAAFQDSRAVWHDNRMDFVTNEVCINANVAGLAVSVWFDAFTDVEPDETIPEPDPPVIPTPTPEEENTHTYVAAADSYVRAGIDEEDYNDNNYGTSSIIEIKGCPPEDGYMRQGYFKFDVDMPDGMTVTGAKLRLYGSGDTTAVTKVFSVEDDSWTEDGEEGITYNNCPAMSAEPLVTVTVTSTAQYYEYDVTGFVQSEAELGQSLISFGVTGRDAEEDVKVTFNSRENSENRPQLVITYRSGGTPLEAAKVALVAAITAEAGPDHANPVYVLDQTNYTEESWTAYTNAIAAAIAVEGASDATLEQVMAAKAAIDTAKAGLTPVAGEPDYILAIGPESAGGAGQTRTITIGGTKAGNLTGKHLVVQFTEGTGEAAKVLVVMISAVNQTVSVSCQASGTKVEVWLASGMPDLVGENMGVEIYAHAVTNQ